MPYTLEQANNPKNEGSENQKTTFSESTKKFMTIRETAKTGILPEYRLRCMRAEGTLPGFAAGTRWYVDIEKLVAVLDRMSEPATETR